MPYRLETRNRFLQFHIIAVMIGEGNVRLRLELLWWVLTLLLTAIFMLPIFLVVKGYPFPGTNALFIIFLISATRYIFMLKQSWIAYREWPKLAIIASSAILFFVLITSLGDFNSFVREEGLQDLVSHLPVGKQRMYIRYIHNEMLFFGVGSVICSIVLPIRMLISIWRRRNTGGV